MKENNGGITFLGLLQVAFIVLKLCRVIDWSWWTVFMPSFGAILGVAIIFIILIWLS